MNHSPNSNPSDPVKLKVVNKHDIEKGDLPKEEYWYLKDKNNTPLGPFHVDNIRDFTAAMSHLTSNLHVASYLTPLDFRPIFEVLEFQRRRPQILPNQDPAQVETIFWLAQGQKSGPISSQEFQRKLDAHELLINDQISLDNGKSWKKIYQYPQFDRRLPSERTALQSTPTLQPAESRSPDESSVLTLPAAIDPALFIESEKEVIHKITSKSEQTNSTTPDSLIQLLASGRNRLTNGPGSTPNPTPSEGELTDKEFDLGHYHDQLNAKGPASTMAKNLGYAILCVLLIIGLYWQGPALFKGLKAKLGKGNEEELSKEIAPGVFVNKNYQMFKRRGRSELGGRSDSDQTRRPSGARSRNMAFGRTSRERSTLADEEMAPDVPQDEVDEAPLETVDLTEEAPPPPEESEPVEAPIPPDEAPPTADHSDPNIQPDRVGTLPEPESEAISDN